MDHITTAVIAALVAGVVDDNASGTIEQTTMEAYRSLKSALRQRYGPHSDLVDALEKLEQKPDSVGRKELFKEEIADAEADQDPKLLALAQVLLESLESKPGGEQDVQTYFRPPRLARADKFVGRETELAELLTNLQPGQVVGLWGPGGIGKSALAAEAIWKLAPGGAPPEIFPDGIIYHSFYNQSRSDIVLEHVARTFGETPVPTPYEAAQRALSKKQALLVLDGAEQADDLPGILAMRGGCGVLVISRQRHESVPEWQEIPPLPVGDAVSLLQGWGGWYAKDESSTHQICTLVGGLPLAVRLAGQYLITQKEKAADYLAWLETTSLTTMEPEQRWLDCVPLLLEHSLAQVSETARQALAVVGLMAVVPFEPDVVVETLKIEANQGFLPTMRKIFKRDAEQETPDVNLALDRLVDYGFLWRLQPGYEVSHSLIHTYVRQHLTTPKKAMRRLATYYMALAWEQSMLGPEGYAKLDANRPHIIRVLTEAVESEDWEAAYGLAVAVEDYLDQQGYWSERVIANEVGLIAAWQLRRPSEGAWLGNLGDTYRTMGHAKWAIEHFEKALAKARETGDRHSEGNSLGNLGLAHRDLGQIDQARSYLQQALAMFERIDSPSAEMVRTWLAELEDE